MSGLGQNAKSRRDNRMSVSHPISTIIAASQHFAFGPIVLKTPIFDSITIGEATEARREILPGGSACTSGCWRASFVGSPKTRSRPIKACRSTKLIFDERLIQGFFNTIGQNAKWRRHNRMSAPPSIVTFTGRARHFAFGPLETNGTATKF